MVNLAPTSSSSAENPSHTQMSVQTKSVSHSNQTTKQVPSARSRRAVLACQISLLLIRLASIIFLGLGIAFLAVHPLGWSLLIAAASLAITSLVCAIIISIYQTLTIRKLQREVSSLGNKRPDVIFIESCADDGAFSFDSPFSGIGDECESPLAPPLSPEDHSYVSKLIAFAENSAKNTNKEPLGEN